MAPLLEVSGLKAYYGATEALHGLSFALEKGGITTLLGANGAGKTTTLRAISGLVKRDGRITFDGEAIDRAATEDIARRGVAHVPEGRGTFTGLSVEENLKIASYGRRDKSGVKRDLDLVFTYFPRLKERLHQQAGTLSGGEQQMLAIGRCLMGEPELVMFDEPSLGLAPAVVQDVLRTIRDLAEGGLTCVLVEQNVAVSLRLASRGYVLENGRITLSGTGEALLADDGVRKAYLGM